MSNLKNKIINNIIEVEGGFVDNPHDSGGPTNYGITERVARQNGYLGYMRDIPEATAFEIYSRKYWDRLHLDSVESISFLLAEEIADTGVNMGTKRAAAFVQRSLNVLNRRGSDYDDLVVDGELGPATVRTLGEYLSLRGKSGEVVLFKMLNALQGAFYVELAERREKDETFIFGWFKNRI